MNAAFWKVYAEGNSYVVVEDASVVPGLLPRVVDPARGLGGDGVLVADWRDEGSVGMRVFNPDGTEAPMCGNGARCLAALAVRTGRADPGRPVVVHSAGGDLVHRLDDPDRLVFTGTLRLPGEPIVARPAAGVLQLELGTQHRVEFRPLDPEFQADPDGRSAQESWPGGTNVMFAAPVRRGVLEVVPWERGVGTTAGCCTGAAAACIAAVASLPGWPEQTVVRQPGGRIVVGWSAATRTVSMCGAVRIIASGTVCAE
ncbi:diaminopimelate epimerase [Amycolatopsis anabasis]|uniref:diaminopimelate epimerase n=1 Tax=Amycolatopsis anabasis TaxID=1840409 RepID=UPI00131CB25E|nr:diaminopimelate epimerase [Amycolatopsis anabasis]